MTSVPGSHLCLLLVRATPVDRVPALPWALGDALSFIARNAVPGSDLSVEAAPFTGTPARVDHAVAAVVRALALDGQLEAIGVGGAAGYRPIPGAELTHGGCSSWSGRDRATFEQAVQRLDANCTIWSKAFAVSGSVMPATV